MAAHDPAKIRNIAVVGHRGTGKTSLVEALLYASGAVTRLGTVADGNTVCDYDDDEKRRGMSISAAITHEVWRGVKLNLIDTPGEPSFLADTFGAIMAADASLVVVNATAGVEVQTERVWNRAREAGKARAAVVNMLDRERASFADTVAALHDLDPACIPVEIPIGAEHEFRGVIDLLHMTATIYAGGDPKGAEGPIPDEMKAEADAGRERLVDLVAEADDALIEKYLGGEELTHEEVESALKEGIREGRIVPVTCAAGGKGIGGDRLLDLLLDLPSPLDAGSWPGIDPRTGDEVEIVPRAEGPAVVYCFKTLADQFSGKINVLRVVTGTLPSDTQVVCVRTGSKERVGHLMALQGKDHQNVDALGPGDIGAVAKLKDVQTGDVLIVGNNPVAFAPIAYPPAVMSFAMVARQGEEDKVVQALRRMQEEDPTLDVHREEQTHDLIVAGLSQMHVEVVVDRLKRRFGLEVDLKPPRVPYRETITVQAQAEGKHKKQTGGRGQFGDCWLRVEPLPRGGGFEFEDKIVGGAIPRGFIPAVEKGVQEALVAGTIAGYPLVDVKVTLYDGKFHPVDSSEMAFKIAGSLGMKAAVEKAHPVLLEPIMLVETTVPEDLVGDVMGDLNSRRGRPLGMEAKGSAQVVRAEVPMSEMLSYAADLRSMSGGRADYTMEFLRYEELPAHLTQKAVEAAKAAA
ncbi:MAG: elongation factor G [Thermoleophilia bacterium]|jgi:elongation factor G|nr:elongation factor G [Thermoleophilia bacterium]